MKCRSILSVIDNVNMLELTIFTQKRTRKESDMTCMEGLKV